MNAAEGLCQKRPQVDDNSMDEGTRAMASFIEATEIEAPVACVWDILSDIGSIAEWNPGLVGSTSTNQREGIGATRFCDIDGRQNLDEEVVLFEPGQAITFRIIRSTLPFRCADIRFRLTADGERTVVTVSPIYCLKYGALGRILDRMLVARAYREGMRGLLSGLKARAEAATPTGY